MKTPRVEILYFDGCPNHEAKRELVKRVAAEFELDTQPEFVEVPDPETARTMHFLGASATPNASSTSGSFAAS